MRKNKLLSLSTTNRNEPYICSAFYAFDKNFNLYIWTDVSSKHAENIKKNSNVAVSIADTRQALGSLVQGLQVTGSARRITSQSEIQKASSIYSKRFPKIKKLMKAYEYVNPDAFRSAIYKIEPLNIKIIDEKAFGKEIYREVSFV